MLDLVLNPNEIKKPKLLKDTVYEWHRMGVEEQGLVFKKENKPTIEFYSNGKFKWSNNKKLGYWYMLGEHELVFEQEKQCHRMKYCSERDVWK